MGKALAEAAVQQGADVILVSGPVPEDHLPHASCCRVVPVVGAMEMLEASRQELPHADAILYVAAVADYRPETCSQEKAPKASEPFDLRLVPNPDLAATLNAEKPSHTFTIGFALQTHEGEEQARKKLAAKSLDGIVLNYPDSMGSLQGRFQYLSATSDAFENWGPLSKTGAAQRILRHIPIQETP
jgi:phosphopantothenoylcysteine decarboxylase/phosphopantothenate--cysteine ligase